MTVHPRDISSTCAPPRSFRVRIGRVVSYEYGIRRPEHIPQALFTAGIHDIDEAAARLVLHDAEFNADALVGPHDMPRGTRRAYSGLARQLRALLATSRGKPSLLPLELSMQPATGAEDTRGAA